MQRTAHRCVNAPLVRRLRGWTPLLLISLMMQGCGLAVDAVQKVWPIASNELDAICARAQVRVGMSVEPFRPFVFPAIYTDEGVRITGLDVALVRAVTAALTDRCGGKPVIPLIELVRFRDLFVELNEGKIDFFISAKTMNVISPTEAGLAYSNPYYYDGGVIGIAKKHVATQLGKTLHGKSAQRDIEAFTSALKGLRIGVQSVRSPHRYAEANLRDIRLILCDSLPAAFESRDPEIDVILGKRPILEHIIKSTRKEWETLKDEFGRPWVLTEEHYGIVMAEDDHALRWFINDLLFRMEHDGRLAQLRRRWIEEDYAYPRRAASEGLPFDANKMPQHYDQGSCRTADQ
jgi:ABC-type amino acid transport substrate-binding protein